MERVIVVVFAITRRQLYRSSCKFYPGFPMVYRRSFSVFGKGYLCRWVDNASEGWKGGYFRA